MSSISALNNIHLNGQFGDYDDKNENVIKNLWKDGLEVSIASKELVYFLKHEAY